MSCGQRIGRKKMVAVGIKVRLPLAPLAAWQETMNSDDWA